MSPFSHDDEDLSRFLRRHRAHLPEASPDLEDRIVRSLPKRSHFSRPVVLFAASIAACAIGLIIAQPARSPTPDTANLEAFVENNWSTAIDEASTPETPSDYLAFVESTN